MFKFQATIIGVFLLFFCQNLRCEISTASNPALANLLAMSEAQIDIATVALELAKEVYPELDGKKYLDAIDAISHYLTFQTRGIQDPEFRIRAINSYLFRELKYKYDLEDPFVKNPNNRYLNGVLETRQGSCITLPLLYIAIGQRLGYPIYPVLVPEHFFVRYADPKLTRQNIETTGNGGFSSDEEYQEEFKISDQAVKDSVYLKTLTYKEYLSELVAINAVYHFFTINDYEKGLSYIESAIKLRPSTPELYRTKARMHAYLKMKLASKGNSKLASTHGRLANILTLKAKKIGLITLPKDEYLEKLRLKKEKLKNSNITGV